MPRPRILCSPRSKTQKTDEKVNQQKQVITISESEEPDCEIIEIENDNEHKKKISLQVRGVAHVQYHGSQCLPSMLSLQFLPTTSSTVQGCAGGQNVVMVMPVSTSQSQVFNPTLCTLEKIENPNEISEIKQVIGLPENSESSDNNVCLNRPGKKQQKTMQQASFTHISADKHRQINDQQDAINKIARKEDSSVEPIIDDCFLQEPSTSCSTLPDRRLSVVEINPDLTGETIDFSGKAGPLNLRSEESECNVTSNEDKKSPYVEFSDTSGSSGNRKNMDFDAKKTNIKSNYSTTLNKKISLSKISIHKKNLILNGTKSSSIRKNVAGDVNSGAEKKATTLITKNSVKNENTGTSGKKIAKDSSDSSAKPETKIVMNKATDNVHSGAMSKSSTIEFEKHTDDENTSDSYECFSPDVKSVEKTSKKEYSATKSTASGIKNCEAEFLWNLNCIVCRKNFSDRTILHRHATLAHPDIQILFCEFCNDSFLTQEKLEAHRFENCRAEITEILETIVIEDEEDDPPSSEEIFVGIANETMIPETDDESLKIQSMKRNQVPESQKLKTRRLSAGILIRRKRGRPRTNFANFVATHKYVEKEVMNHAIGEKKKELSTAKIKKLVVPIPRLEDSTLEKYLQKHKQSKLSDYQDGEESPSKTFRQRKRRPQRNYNNVGNLKKARKAPRNILELKKVKTNLRCAQKIRNASFSRCTDKIGIRNRSKRICNEQSANRGKFVRASVKKRPIYTDTDDTSDDSGAKYIPIVEEGISGDNKRSIIRKLPSKSSAASLVSLKTNVKDRQRQRVKLSPEKTYGEWILRRRKIVDCSDCVEKSIKKHTEPETCRISSERMTMEIGDNTKLDAPRHSPNDAQLKEPSKNLEENRQQNEDKTGSSNKSAAHKTYLPSKRKALNAKKLKRRCDLTSDDLCLMCKELVELMKQLAGHFDGNKANKISVKCPFCTLYFISMFYLKKHVSKSHLHCQNQFPSQLSESLMLTKLENDYNLNCKTEIGLSLECPHCSDAFSIEMDLVDHVFTRHIPPISREDTVIDLPYYVDDFPSSYFQRSDRLNTIKSSTKSRPRNAVNRLIVDRESVTLTSKSVEPTSKVVELTKASEISSKSVKPVKSSHSTNISIKSSNNAAGVELTSVCSRAEKYCCKETPSTSQPIKEDQATSDRNYLLKQLLSDDSNDCFDDPDHATLPYIRKAPKFLRKITVESEGGFTCTQCHVCDKEFRRTQDLLIHSLEHDFSSANSEESLFNSMLDTSCVFADPVEYDWFNEKSTPHTAQESQPEESGTTAEIPKPIANDYNTSDVLCISDDENNDFSLVYKNSDEPETGTESPNRKSTSPAFESSSKKEKPENVWRSKSRVEKRASNLILEDAQTHPKKLKVLQEFLETEKGLANPVEAESNSKLPIECSKCNRKFPNQALLNEHLFFLHDDSLKVTVLTDVSPMSCPGDEDSETSRQWRCDECFLNFKLLRSYGRHRYFVHGDDEMVHVCENCCKVMTTVTMVNVHICTDVASYNCRSCNETFTTGMSLRLHNMYKHKETEGPHKCLPCNKKFLTNAMLKRHEKWEHRFMRPYRPRKNSPVHMGTLDDVPSKCDDHFVKNEMDNGCDQEYVDLEYEFTGKEATEPRKRVFQSPEDSQKKIISQEKNDPRQETLSLRKDPLRQSSLVTCIDEGEIIQCNLCQLYCLSMVVLRTHMANSHSILGEVCRICDKMYSKGKLIRHMIDQHVNPCETYTEDAESIWNVGKTVEEKDAEELIRILGMSRFISLCEYQRFSESTLDGAVRCPNCTEEFENCEDYKVHFLMKHDIMCALCNIEFKSGDKAAAHKIEDHGSVDLYIWFADQTVGALTAVTNFSEAAEKSFFKMISKESDESHDENEDEDCGEENQTCAKYFATENDEEYKRVEETDKKASFPEVLEEQNDQKLMIVVTDDDLRYYGIGTRNPNIWGLAAKISSTSTKLTPKDVKVMLDSYFEK